MTLRRPADGSPPAPRRGDAPRTGPPPRRDSLPARPRALRTAQAASSPLGRHRVSLRPIGYRAPSARRLIRRPLPDDRSSHPSVVRRNGISHLGSITKGEIRASKQRQTTPQRFWLGVTFLHQTGVGLASP